jgi:hypothetical protein
VCVSCVHLYTCIHTHTYGRMCVAHSEQNGAPINAISRQEKHFEMPVSAVLISMYAYKCCVYICKYIHIYIYIYINIYYGQMYATRICISSLAHTNTYTHTYIHIIPSSCLLFHTHIHTLHIHTCMRKCKTMSVTTSTLIPPTFPLFCIHIHAPTHTYTQVFESASQCLLLLAHLYLLHVLS